MAFLFPSKPMKQIQEWLGHSDMSTTATIYSHLDAVTKADTGAAMSKALGKINNRNSKARSTRFGLLFISLHQTRPKQNQMSILPHLIVIA